MRVFQGLSIIDLGVIIEILIPWHIIIYQIFIIGFDYSAILVLFMSCALRHLPGTTDNICSGGNDLLRILKEPLGGSLTGHLVIVAHGFEIGCFLTGGLRNLHGVGVNLTGLANGIVSMHVVGVRSSSPVNWLLHRHHYAGFLPFVKVCRRARHDTLVTANLPLGHHAC